MRRILVVITTAYIPTGGLASVMMNYYRNIDRSGLKIDFASTNDAPKVLTDELFANGSRYIQLPPRKNVLGYFNALKNVCKGYDVIHVNGNSATTVIEHLAAKLTGVKKRVNHNHTSIPDHKTTSDILYPLFKILITDRVACSDLAGNWLYGKGNFLILRNAVDVEKYRFNAKKRALIRKDFGISNDCIVIGHLGKIYKPKNHPYLVKIFNEYHQFNPKSILFLVGDGVMRQEVEALVDELNLRDHVIFAGLRTDVPDMLQVMDYFVFPSIWEGMPLSVLEALSSGLTCVISDHITKDVMIGPHVSSLSIEEQPTVWAKYVYNLPLPNRSLACEESAGLVTDAGYNIKVEAKELLKLYNS